MLQGELFDELPEHPVHSIEFRDIRTPLWTESKAKLVAEYLRLFVFITKHGCYIDGFAGPKQPDIAGTWAAELVLNSEPRMLREFFLCDLDQGKVEALKRLRDSQPATKGRKIEVLEGDFNDQVLEILASGVIKEKTATFCLLDQFSSECHWATVKAIAEHKTGTAKIEQFYFLASGWLDRTLAAFTRNIDRPERWWGGDDWRSLVKMPSLNRALLVCDRFKDELGYKYAYPWPILERGSGGKVMFHMIHATDHPEAPKLMARAYSRVTGRAPAEEQIELPLDMVRSIASAYAPRLR